MTAQYSTGMSEKIEHFLHLTANVPKHKEQDARLEFSEEDFLKCCTSVCKFEVVSAALLLRGQNTFESTRAACRL